MWRASIEVPEAFSEAVQAFFWEENALGVEIEDDETRAVPGRSFEPTQRAIIKAMFADDFRDKEKLEEHLKATFEKTEGLSSIVWETLEEQDWEAEFKASWKSLYLGEGVWIVPSWERDQFEVPENAVALYLDPGMAFGTGHHETTALCARSLAVYLRSLDNRASCRVLDVGTGTGILAILAACLGVNRVVATDIDPKALEVAQENAAENGALSSITFSEQAPDAQGPVYDVIVANILANPLVEMAPQIINALAPNGRLLLSGILQEQADAVKEAYLSHGLQLLQIKNENEWVIEIFIK